MVENLKRAIIAVVFGAILFLIFNYFLLVTINPFFPGIYVLIIFILVIVSFIIWNKSGRGYDKRGNFNRFGRSGSGKKIGKHADAENYNIVALISMGLIAALLIVMLVIVIGACPVFKDKDYRAMLGTVTNKSFEDEITQVDMTQLPIVDMELAKNLADKKLGEEVALGSVVTIKEGTLCSVNGKLMYVFPLLHSGLWKYLDNPEGTPGYITVSATDPGDVKMITKVGDKEIKIKYQDEAFFGADLDRYLYEHYSKTTGLADKTFELDDNGYPYWTVTKYKNTIGFGGEKVTGLVTVNAMTGEIKDYSLKDIPSWVDRVYPQGFIETQINDWGKYINGWWNPSKKGQLQLASGDNYLYNKGNCYLYTGITSVGSDESTVGFMLTDTRTHESTFFKVAGATELAGKSSIEGKVQEKEYTANFPYLINVEGIPTYFSPMKDKKGLVKMYGFCSVEDYSIVGVGDSLAEAKSSYVKALQTQGNSIVIDKSDQAVSNVGTIDRIGMGVDDGTSYYYIILKEIPDQIFIGNQTLSMELPITREGDQVKITYNKSDNNYIDMMAFDNLMYTQKKSQDQLKVEEQKSQK